MVRFEHLQTIDGTYESGLGNGAFRISALEADVGLGSAPPGDTDHA